MINQYAEGEAEDVRLRTQKKPRPRGEAREPGRGRLSDRLFPGLLRSILNDS